MRPRQNVSPFYISPEEVSHFLVLTSVSYFSIKIFLQKKQLSAIFITAIGKI